MSGFLNRLVSRGKQASPAAAVAAAAARRAAEPPRPSSPAERSIVPADYGLPARTQLRNDILRPMPELDTAREEVRAGRWEAVAALFDRTGNDWELRYYYVTTFASLAADEDAWLRAWLAARPQDAAAATVYARSLVDLAWKIRGGGWAKDVTREQWEGFFRVLGEAPAACHAAAALAPEDPTPWIVHFAVGMGSSYEHADFRALWAEATARAPYHVKGHLSAMTYWLPRWKGSRELVTAFVEEAIASAPRGSLLTAMRFELMNTELRPADPAEREPYWRGEEVRRAIDEGLADLAAADPGHLRVSLLRSWLSLFLTRAGRHAEAVAVFRELGTSVGSEPWTYSADGTSLYVSMRNTAVLGWEEAGRPALPDGRSPLDAPGFPAYR